VLNPFCAAGAVRRERDPTVAGEGRRPLDGAHRLELSSVYGPAQAAERDRQLFDRAEQRPSISVNLSETSCA
jgi:hypothetical protein